MPQETEPKLEVAPDPDLEEEPLEVEVLDCKVVAAGLPHRTPDRAQLILTAGKRGYGKTTFIRSFIRSREPRVLALDPFQDFRGLRWGSEDDCFEALAEGTPCRRRISPPIDQSSRPYAEEFFERCIHDLSDCLLVLDEITLWSGIDARGPLQTLVLQGRRLGIRMVVASQRIALVPGVVLSEATDMVLFKTTRPRDRKIIEEWTDWDVAQRARTLDVGECVHVET